MGRELVIILLDTDNEYLQNFTEYCMNNDNEFSLISFSETVNMAEYCNESSNFDLIVISQYCISDELINNYKGKIAILNDDKHIEFINDCKTIYKYQSADKVISDILNICAEDKKEIRKENNLKIGNDRIIGIYSPVNRCGKTTLSLELCKNFENKKVLLINFESYSTIMENLELEEGYNLSDLLYFYIKNEGRLDIKLEAIKRQYQGIDIIPPIKNPKDLKEVSDDVWIDFINKIRSIDKYEIIVLDISNVFCDISVILDLCDVILMPVLEDTNSCIKKEKFLQHINCINISISEKIKEISMNNILKYGYENILKDLLENGGGNMC